MKRPVFYLIFILLVTLTSSCGDQKQPNFLFFLADDLGWMDLGFNNPETFYETPHLDKLASEGMRFSQGYAACPVCSPTRASIMTGKYPSRLNTTDYFGAIQPEAVLERRPGYHISKPLLPASYLDYLPHEEITLAETLREAGYATFFAGKWHLGPEGYWPEDQGFDVNIGGITRGGPYGGKRYFSPYGNPRIEDGPDGEHLPDRLASEAIKFIHDHPDVPWLAYVSFYSVHTPLMTRDDLKEKYEALRAENPIPSEDIWGQEGERKVRLVQEHAVYAGMVESLDLAAGKVLDYLREEKLDRNTIVFFMSDNGGLSTSEGHPTSNLPLRAGKGWLYEGGIREPMLIKWPGETKPGAICDVPVISTDFYPTILEMAGIDPMPDQHLDGISLVPVITGDLKSEEEFQTLFWCYPHYGNQGGSPGAAIRKGDFKLIEFWGPVEIDGELKLGAANIELYNIVEDIGEKNNLAESMPELRDELLELLHSWQNEVDARLPSVNRERVTNDK